MVKTASIWRTALELFSHHQQIFTTYLHAYRSLPRAPQGSPGLRCFCLVEGLHGLVPQTAFLEAVVWLNTFKVLAPQAIFLLALETRSYRKHATRVEKATFELDSPQLVAFARMLCTASCEFSCRFRSPKSTHRNLLINIYDGCVPGAPLSHKGHKGQRSGRR